MKLSRILATGAAAALVAGSTFLVGGTAAADDFYVYEDDFTAETNPYGTGWFIGGGSTGTLSSGLSGLTLDGTTGLIQILHGTVPTQSLTELVEGMNVAIVGTGDAYFQIPMFQNFTGADSNFTTLRPADPDADLGDVATQWITSWAFGSFAAGSSHTIAEYEAELDLSGGPAYEILAYGLYVNPGETATVASINFSDLDTYDTTLFLPLPTATVVPASITLADFAATGVTGTFTGFIPGEEVSIGYGTGSSGSGIETVIADENGAVVYHWVADFTQPVSITFGGFGLESSARANAALEVTANVLPATGFDGTPIALGGAALLLAGFGAIAIRRRANA